MTNKHTPAPWEVTEGNYGGVTLPLHVMNCEGWAIADMAHGYSSIALGEHKANAHLISAAPDLLEALEASRRYLAEDDNGVNELAQSLLECIDAAIEKATK